MSLRKRFKVDLWWSDLEQRFKGQGQTKFIEIQKVKSH